MINLKLKWIAKSIKYCKKWKIMIKNCKDKQKIQKKSKYLILRISKMIEDTRVLIKESEKKTVWKIDECEKIII